MIEYDARALIEVRALAALPRMIERKKAPRFLTSIEAEKFRIMKTGLHLPLPPSLR